jgi:hypothetical protein
VKTWDGFLVKSRLGCVEVGFIRLWVSTVRLHDAIEIVVIEEMSLLLIY